MITAALRAFAVTMWIIVLIALGAAARQIATASAAFPTTGALVVPHPVIVGHGRASVRAPWSGPRWCATTHRGPCEPLSTDHHGPAVIPWGSGSGGVYGALIRDP